MEIKLSDSSEDMSIILLKPQKGDVNGLHDFVTYRLISHGRSKSVNFQTRWKYRCEEFIFFFDLFSLMHLTFHF